jgi:hypothetical protein
MTEQDLRDAFDRMVAAGPPPTGGTQDVLAAARRARRRRSLLTIAGAAAAAVAVLVAGSVLFGPTSAAPPAGQPTPTAPPAPPTVPGISPTETQKIVEICGAGYTGAEPGPGLALYNAIKSPWGMRYLLYGPHTYISCLHATEGDWRVRGDDGPTQWLRAPLVVDWSIADGVPYDRGPGTYSAEGRVTSSVATVRVRHGSAEVTVPAVNGTFEVSLSVPAAELGSATSFQPYDAAGHLLLTRTSAADPPGMYRACWVSPDGTVLPTVVPTAPGQKCEPAVRWR